MTRRREQLSISTYGTRSICNRLAPVLAGIITLAAARGIPAAYAQEPVSDTVSYRVKPGDLLELIAAEFYSDRNKAVFILVENKMARPRPLKPGERLRIPVSREITTAPGDTFESLAGTYLGNARRGTFLADFNAMSVDDSLPAGTQLTIPLTITHTAASIESMGEISRVYFGDAKSAELLKRYNFLDKVTIDKGDTLIVPAYHVRLPPAKLPAMDAESKARRDHRRDAMARIAKALPAARVAWKDGDFSAVKAALVPSDPDLDYLDTGEAIEAGVLLGAGYVAFNDTEAATTLFRRVAERQPHATLKRYQYSPKILAVWQKAGGLVE
jgi:LysM repeat protein